MSSIRLDSKYIFLLFLHISVSRNLFVFELKQICGTVNVAHSNSFNDNSAKILMIIAIIPSMEKYYMNRVRNILVEVIHML